MVFHALSRHGNGNAMTCAQVKKVYGYFVTVKIIFWFRLQTEQLRHNKSKSSCYKPRLESLENRSDETDFEARLQLY